MITASRVSIAAIAIGVGVALVLNIHGNVSAVEQAPQAPPAAPATPTSLPGLIITDTKVGTGAAAKNGDQVSVLYTGRLKGSDTPFDSTAKRNNTPFQFTLGAGNVIKGWDVGVLGMKVGGKRTLTIPPELGYGPDGTGPIPGNATLVFDIELVSIP